MISCRLLPYAVAAGAHNMAADEVLLESAGAGSASLRFYGWSTATVSLGYFQQHQLRSADERLARLAYVRRPSGGMTLVHHHELTYALALPAGAPWQTRGAKPWLCRMHDVIAEALRNLGVETQAGCQASTGKNHSPPSLCFQHVTPGDLLIDAAKIVGSAQRRQRGALLQHGAILLERSPHAPSLAGIGELAGQHLDVAELVYAIVNAWSQATGWRLESAPWSADETDRIGKLVRTKYGQASWNDRR